MQGLSSEGIYSIRSLLSELIPIGPKTDWEIQEGYGNRTTPEQVVTWMEGTASIISFF